MLNKLIVNAYKIAGFIILSGILLGLASYVVLTIFYYGSTSWVAPVIVSPSDRRVLELNAQLAQQQSMRDALIAQRAEMTTKLHDAERVAQAESDFQDSLRATLAADLEDRKAAYGKLASLRRQVAGASAQIADANSDFAGMSKDRMKGMFDARLATKDEVVRANAELASLAGTNLELAQKQVTIEQQLWDVRRQADSLAVVGVMIHGGNPTKMAFAWGDAKPVVPTREVLAAQREFDLSVLQKKRANEETAAIRAGISAADATLVRYDALLAAIKETPYLKAVDHHLTVAFVPYANLDSAKPGTPVYSCAANIVWCTKVGVVGEVLEGEVTGQNPLQRVELRGAMVRLDVADMRSAREPVLHAGRKPLFF
ncbi:MAG TPA: hypothetical protein VIF62_39675 [Labilithrix sp.]|jgi:hypothetical protein